MILFMHFEEFIIFAKVKCFVVYKPFSSLTESNLFNNSRLEIKGLVRNVE